MALPFAASAEDAAHETLEPVDYLREQAQIDEMLIAESQAGYDFEAPMVVLNPYGNAPLSAVAIMILRCYAAYDSKGDLRWALTDTGANAITRMDNGH